MAIFRCPQCKLILTAEEVSAPVCPGCASPLPSRPAPAPAVNPPEPSPADANGGTGLYRILLAAAMIVIVVLGGILVVNSTRRKSDPREIVQLREAIEAAEEQLRDVQGDAAKAIADRAEVEAKLVAAEKAAVDVELKRSAAEQAAADAKAQLASVTQEAAAEKERVKKLEQDRKEALARLEALQAVKASQPAAEAGKRGVPNLPVVADGAFWVLHINRPDGDYRLPTLNNGCVVKLVGKVKTLRLEYIDGSTLDASELVAHDIVLVSGINNKSKVKLNAPQGSVTVPFVDGRSQVDIAAPEGKVQIGWINGSAQVNVVTRDFTLRDYLDGRDTTLTATLTAAGRIQFRELRGPSHLLWKKALPADPDVEVQSGIIRRPAEFRQLTPEK